MMADMVYVDAERRAHLRCIFEIVLSGGGRRRGQGAGAVQDGGAAHVGPADAAAPVQGHPADILAKVERKDLAWERYYDLTSQEIGERFAFPKMGKAIHKFVHQFPRSS